MTTKIVSHTPGPWHVSADGNDVENVVDAGVCALYADETVEANARLIAAAPEMLEALRAMLSEFGRTVGQAWDDVPETEAERLACAAIAKAEGR